MECHFVAVKYKNVVPRVNKFVKSLTASFVRQKNNVETFVIFKRDLTIDQTIHWIVFIMLFAEKYCCD